jgi:hypothetical protein
MVEEALTDAAVLARMRAAVEVLRDAGLDIDITGNRESHLRRAVRWQRYSRGPVSALHRDCAADIVRGSLRLWSLAGGVPVGVSPSGPVARPLARVRLTALVRSRCAALRADLTAEAAGLSRRGVGSFEDKVRREFHRVAAEVDAALAEFGLPADSSCLHIEPLLPPLRRPRLENQLTTLIGAGFGIGVSLTIGRLAAALFPALFPSWVPAGWMPTAAVGCGMLGVALTTWIVLARRLLAERNAAERWMLESLANIRPALEERMLTRLLVAELAVN